MIEEPKNSRSQRTRDAILDATYALLRDGGATSVTMGAVAEAAGCSRRALYLHFASRVELLVAMVGYADHRFGLASHMTPVLEAEGPLERLRAYGRFLGAYHTKIAPLVRAIDQERDTDEAARAAWNVAAGHWRTGAESVVRELVAAKVLHPRFADPEDAVDLMCALMSVDLIRRLVDEQRWSPEKYGAYMGEMFLAVLVDDAARPPPDRLERRTPLATE